MGKFGWNSMPCTKKFCNLHSFQWACRIVTPHQPVAYQSASECSANSLNLTGLQKASHHSLWWVIKQKHATCVKLSPHLAWVLIVSGVWAWTNSCNQPLPDVSDRLSVWPFVRRGVTFDPPKALAGVLSWGGTKRNWNAHNGSAATSQKGLWCTVVKNRHGKVASAVESDSGNHPASLTKSRHATGIIIEEANILYNYSTIYIIE